jgi:hypothetical protein
MTGKTNGDWLGEAMKTFIPEIDALAKLPEDRLLAVDLIIFLVKHSYTDIFRDYTSKRENDSIMSSRPMDVAADAWLVTLIHEDSEQCIKPHVYDKIVI